MSPWRRNSRALTPGRPVSLSLMLGLVLGPVLSVSLAGCAAIPLTTFAAAGTAVQSGVSIWKSGRLDTAKWAPISSVVGAADLAMRDLSLEYISREYYGPRVEWTLLDNANREVEIRFYERTETITELRIDLGLFGNQSTARLILERIEAHLPPPEAMAENPGPGTNER